MNHPDPAEWMAFLYDEPTRESRANLEAHLAGCPECSDRVAHWRNTMHLLDTAPIPECPPSSANRFPILRLAGFAAAAAGILAMGIAIGRWGVMDPSDLESRLAVLQSELTTDMARRRNEDLANLAQTAIQVSRAENRALLADILREFRAARDADHRAWLAALEHLDARHGAESAVLRQGLAQLASSTGSGFEQARNHLRLMTLEDPSNTHPSRPQPIE